MKRFLAVFIVCGFVLSVLVSGYFPSYDIELQDIEPVVCLQCPVPDYNIIPDRIKLPDSAIGLIEAGKVFPGANVCKSELNPILQEMATRHAKYQASHNKQGHQLFDQRVKELTKTLGKYKYAEIAAESWKRQANAPMSELGKEMFESWKQSSGHWKVASTSHKYFGADMAKGSNGIWYACILVAD